MYLSELFLDVMDATTGDISQKTDEALWECDKALLKRLKGYGENLEGNFCEYFFDGGEPNDNYTELMNFAERYEEYKNDISEEQKERTKILGITYLVNTYYATRIFDENISRMSDKEKKYANELFEHIESIYNMKYMKILVKRVNGWRILFEYPMDNFCRQVEDGNYFAAMNGLIEVMNRTGGGLAVVVAGSKGLTPQRMHGFWLEDRRWKNCSNELLESVKDLIFSDGVEDAMAKRRSYVMGERQVI